MGWAVSKVVLCVLDGWGIGAAGPGNAIAMAKTPNWDRIYNSDNYLHCQLRADGEYVGLPSGQMGNSEVGHITIGAGRVVRQSLSRINHEISSGNIYQRPGLKNFIADLRRSGGACHVMGLCSDGGVHSSVAHIRDIVRHISEAGVRVCLHAFLDGRDVAPGSAPQFLKELLDSFSGCTNVSLATACGRYYAMDRDGNWDRIQAAYSAICHGVGDRVDDVVSAVRSSIEDGITDEFIRPIVANGYDGVDVSQGRDGFLMLNFRKDRAIQLLQSMTDVDFDAFNGRDFIADKVLGLVKYSGDLDRVDALIPNENVENTLGDVISQNGLSQLRIAETEKYAHVTFFFDGGYHKEFPGCDRVLIDSPKVATYDLQPEMSAKEVTDSLLDRVKKYDLIICNYANADMVGHTGKIDEAIVAVECLDHCIGRIVSLVESADEEIYVIFTADHGNVECMLDPDTKKAITKHTSNPVPFVLIANKESYKVRQLKFRQGNSLGLADVAPTILDLLGVQCPQDMTGKSIVVTSN